MNADPARPCDTCGAIVGHAPCCKIPYMEKPWLSSDPAVREAWLQDPGLWDLPRLIPAIRDLWQALDEARRKMALVEIERDAVRYRGDQLQTERDAAVRERDAVRMELSDAAKVLDLLRHGWSVRPVSCYDEEGIDGWEWTNPVGDDETVLGSHEDIPPLPESIARTALAREAATGSEVPPASEKLPDRVEELIRSFRSTHMNQDGDVLDISDLLAEEEIDALVDHVCGGLAREAGGKGEVKP